MQFLRKGFINRFLAVLTSSGKSCFLKLNETGAAPCLNVPLNLHGLEVTETGLSCKARVLELWQAALFPSLADKLLTAPRLVREAEHWRERDRVLSLSLCLFS